MTGSDTVQQRHDATMHHGGHGGGGDHGAGAGRTGSSTLRRDVLDGLRSTPRTLPAKLFYDARGARLFEQICELPEYYLTRSEFEILETHAQDIAALAGPAATLVEFGSGAGVKVRLLLDALESPAAYVPIDISAEQLEDVAGAIATEYASVEVVPLCADYTRPLTIPVAEGSGRRVAFFPGSTIGNFHPAEATAFLRGIRDSVGAGGALVLGVDRLKDPAVLEAAYDDAAGITAAFNLNLLRRLDRELGADFGGASFRHRAVFNGAASRIEMHLVSTRPQVVTVAGVRFHFAAGQSIWTESSYKYDMRLLESVTADAGFRIEKLWTDSADRFWVGYFLAD